MASVAELTPLVLAYVQPTGKELLGLRVTVDKVVHHRDANFPPETPHAFVYFLTISNLSQETVKLLGRKWIIRYPDGTTEIVEGDGIVGETPTLPPGEKFSYNSYHLAGGPTTAEGSFHGTAQSGERIFTRIPLFAMTPPSDPS
jgi:ApaG protein